MDQIGNYRILQKLGEGGMGEVFRGVDTMLEREVAIKVIRPELSQREDIIQRFRSEAIALGRLNHANIATVYSFAKDGDRYFMALEYVNGESLDKLIAKRGRLAWPEAVRHACAALEGLEHAHRLNVIHRDVKPGNIIIANTGALKLMDFGIARILERARQTREGYVVGTLEYTSPEQIQGLEGDARSDIYSLGMVLYEMLTGRLPFKKNTDYDLLRAQIEELPVPPRVFAPDIPQSLECIIIRALAKNPADRFSSALEFLQNLHHLTTEGVSGHDSLSETRVIVPGLFSRYGIGTSEKLGAEGRWFRVGDLVANHPVAAFFMLVLLLGAPGYLYLANLTRTENGRNAVDPAVSNPDLKPAPPIVNEKTEENHQDHNPPAPEVEIKRTDSIATIPTISPPAESPELEFPSNAREVMPPNLKRDARKAETSNRKQASPRVTVKSRTLIGKPSMSHPKPSPPPDEDAGYWQKIGRNVSATKQADAPPKPPPRTRQAEKDESADYWKSINRETSRFLKGR